MESLKSIADPLFDDTSPEAEAVLLGLYRKMSAQRKFELVRDAIETNRTLLRSGLAMRYPEAGQEEIRRRLADLLLGEELALAAYGPLEDILGP
ncbi:MAG: hypothetical protein AAGN66_13050 [Acidobacteriota bacterium]